MRTPPRSAVRRLALARAISETGSAAAYTALLDAVFIRSGGSAAWLGLTLLVTHGVAGMFGPLGGVLGDKFDRKRVMILSDVASAVAFLGLALVRDPGALVAVGFVSALAEIPFWTSSAAAIPNVVEKPEDIAWANSLVTAGRNAGITLGPVLGGVLVAAAGPRGHEVVFIANAASFVLSVGLVASVRARFSEDRTAEDVAEFRGLRAGYRFLFHDRILRIIAVAWVVVVLGAGIAQVADRPLSAVFHAGAIGFGLLIALWGFGSVVGSIAARRLTERTEPGWLIGGMAIAGVAAIGIWLSPWFPPIVGLMLLMGFGDAMSEVADQGIRQRRTPDAVRGRLIGAMESLVHVAVAIAYVIAAGALVVLGPQGAYALAGLSSLAAALLLLPTIRRLRGGGAGRTGVERTGPEPHVMPSIGDPT
jgi:MFS family permease